MKLTKPATAEELATMVVVGSVISARRRRMGMTQETLADLIGVTQPHVSKLERGLSALSLCLLARTATALHTLPSGLLDAASFDGCARPSEEEGCMRWDF